MDAAKKKIYQIERDWFLLNSRALDLQSFEIVLGDVAASIFLMIFSQPTNFIYGLAHSAFQFKYPNKITRGYDGN